LQIGGHFFGVSILSHPGNQWTKDAKQLPRIVRFFAVWKDLDHDLSPQPRCLAEEIPQISTPIPAATTPAAAKYAGHRSSSATD
jgi:hypothetical protein